MKYDTLERNITKFVRKFGVKRAYCTQEFAYYDNFEVITFTFTRYEDDIDLINYIEKTYEVEDLEPWYFIYSILHEIGHHMTLNQLTEEEYEEENIYRQLITDNEAYFNLKAERLANDWAINYLSEHFEDCWKLQRKCFAIIKHYLKKSVDK